MATAPQRRHSGLEQPCVLIVDDDAELQASLLLALGRRGFEVVAAADSGEALQFIEEGTFPDIIVLDVMMPGMDGVTLCKLLRTRSSVPILMLSARDAVEDKIKGLTSGADDYLQKPFELDELVARLMALGRRAHRRAPEGVLEYGGLRLDTALWASERAGVPLVLTQTEFRLLAFFLACPEVVCRREDLVRGIWGQDSLESDSNSLEVHIANLRQKLEQAGRPRLIHTIRGVGYILRQ